MLWLDDDSHFTDPNWSQELNRFIRGEHPFDVAGQRARWGPRRFQDPSYMTYIGERPWWKSNGHLPADLWEWCPFAVGGLFVARTNYLRIHDYPDRGMTKAAGRRRPRGTSAATWRSARGLAPISSVDRPHQRWTPSGRELRSASIGLTCALVTSIDPSSGRTPMSNMIRVRKGSGSVVSYSTPDGNGYYAPDDQDRHSLRDLGDRIGWNCSRTASNSTTSRRQSGD